MHFQAVFLNVFKGLFLNSILIQGSAEQQHLYASKGVAQGTPKGTVFVSHKSQRVLRDGDLGCGLRHQQ